MGRALALLYGAICYAVFFGSFLYAIWFVWKMDAPSPETDLSRALLIDTGLLLLFAVQHSGMARQAFKRAWTKVVPHAIERSTYVLFASLALIALVYFWQPMPRLIWDVTFEPARMALVGLFWLGWVVVLISTFLIGHFDLFGLKQVWQFWSQKKYEYPVFRVPGFYKFVRHPIYLGFLLAFWCAPRMTLGHLYFSVVTTVWILVAIQWEERDLVTFHGEQYTQYRSGVSMLVPWPGKRYKG